MISQASKLHSFRQELYPLFHKRKDAVMDLLDALTSHGHQYNSIVQLSNSDFFRRAYSSITDAIGDGLPHADWKEITKLVYKYTVEKKQEGPNCFLLDCTPNPRPFANKLADRTIVHSPNPAPGNKPICVGHQYSVLALLGQDDQSRKKHWLIPMDAKRVQSHEKGNEVGMQQLVDCINELGLTDELNIEVSDSLYGTVNCRAIAAKLKNLIHVFRFNSNRNLHFTPVESECNAAKPGRKKEYGETMKLNDTSTHLAANQQTQIPWRSRSGKEYKVIIECWPDMLLRGSRAFRSSKYPVNLIRITVVDQQGNSVFNRPLWLSIFGERRHEVSLIDVYLYYAARYDIEHFFRFGKQKLLLDSYQTPDVEHEELWWRLCLLAYVQLYLARTLVPMLPQPWERYLPEYQDKQRGCEHYLISNITQNSLEKAKENKDILISQKDNSYEVHYYSQQSSEYGSILLNDIENQTLKIALDKSDRDGKFSNQRCQEKGIIEQVDNIISSKNGYTQQQVTTTPAQTQRGFAQVLKAIGTPALPSVARGKPHGRIVGETMKTRMEQNVIFKSSKTKPQAKETILSGSETTSDSSNPGKIQTLLATVKTRLSKINFSPQNFAKMLLDPS